MPENDGISAAKRVINMLEMLQIAVHHERCQAAIEAAASIMEFVATDEVLFTRMMEIHREHFPEDSEEKLRDAYQSLVPTLMHISQNHETGARNVALRECGMGAVTIQFEVPQEVVDKASEMMPTLFDNNPPEVSNGGVAFDHDDREVPE